MKRFVLIIGLLSLLMLPVHSQMRYSNDPPEIIRFFDLLYNYRLSEAKNLLNSLDKKLIDGDLVELSRINLYWWFLISGDITEDWEEEIHLVIDRIVDRLSEKPLHQLSDDEIFTMVHSLAYKTRVNIYSNEYLKGIFNLKRTVDYLTFALDHANRYDKFMLLAGLYNYFAAVTLENNRIFTPFFALAPKSNKKLGFKQLTNCTNLPNLLLSTEARYYLMKANYEIEDEMNSACRTCQELVRLFPDNLIFRYHLFLIMIDTERYVEAATQYKELKFRSLHLPGLTASQRSHLIDEANRHLRKRRIKQFI